MDHTNSQNDLEGNSHCNDKHEEPEARERATLGELYHYLDGAWYFLVVLGLISAFV